MKMFDTTPLFRSSVGFDRMMDMFESVNRLDQSAPTYPPYNIEKTGDSEYRISLAVAGFAEADLEIEAREDTLTVTGRQGKEDEKERKFLHRGIAGRAFERTFRLADHVQVTGAKLENGLLHVELVRNVPEAMKPRRFLSATPSGRSCLRPKPRRANAAKSRQAASAACLA